MSRAEQYDIVIAGGGMVGASLACALAPSGFRVAVIEAHPFGAPGQPSYDDRTLALAYGSSRILTGLGLWPLLAAEAQPIRAIHVSEQGRFGATRLCAEEEGVEALGYVVASRAVGQALYTRLNRLSDVALIAPATISAARMDAEGVELRTRGRPDGVADRSLRGRLVVAADGRDSTVRGLAGIEASEEDYGQTAIIANVTPGRPHGSVAYERFTPSGPLALLPLSADRCSLVWTHGSQEAQTVAGWGEREFLRRLQDRFGYRLGRFSKVGRRQAYPLSLVRARRMTGQRLALVGNAAHSLHPVAGQGYNLALRDVAVLAQVLVDSARAGTDPGDEGVLGHYARWRAADLERTVWFTDLLARLFTNPWPPLSHGRGLGLVAVDLIAPLRHGLARRSMGLTGRQPCLATGRSMEECL